MEELLKTLTSQSPTLVGFLILVIIFVRYLEKRDKENEAAANKFTLMATNLHAEHLDERRLCRDAITANTEAITESSVSNAKTTSALNNLAHMIDLKLK